MANEQNLLKGKETQFRSGEEAVKSGAKGGRASGVAKRRKKDLAMALEVLLEKKYPQYDKNGRVVKKITGTEALTAKLFEKALKGDVRAFETIRATVGQDPVKKVMVAEVEQSVIDEVEQAVLGKK